ncbi:NhaC family Na+:H+ antiporter [Cerasibacillus quisquiliarum]|uniref:Na+/H+ antiporter NhaC n=1 Tax=Cerasibacillus quisquiliarum TaxID=227865 RepID=A0A511UZ48_9BACI|nr:Na+/H+ antiporter NhaC [Cerasibacillus quisquiliarum]MBB5146416.1 NhaC family Na+:H+ antiporter [Cerasibacillus quisquiliarum]GEN30743.1 Na+/H+ antiporter NhaC [Cerasibacillus quisquiliarum]
MFPIQAKYKPHVFEAVIIFMILVGMISYYIIGIGTVPHIPILLGIFFLIIYGLIHRITFRDLHAGMLEGARNSLGALFLFLLIGVLMSSWIISGTIPALIDLGFSIVTGKWFYAIVFTVTAIIGVSLGSSLTTAATIGVAFIGIGQALDASLAITAGAIVSGAFFGDKMSPLSDTTNLASTIVKVDLFDHIKHMSLTTIPAFMISFILFIFLSPKTGAKIDTTTAYMNALQSTGLIHWTSWLPLLVLVIAVLFKMSAFMSITMSSLLATILAIMTKTISFNGVWDIWFKGYTATTDFEPVNTLLSKGGIESMFFTMSLVILALGFGGLLFVTGIIPSILETLQRKLQRVRSIIVSTALTAIGINVLIGEQYLSILLTGETYKNLYNKVGLSNKALSRTLEDAGTVINPLVPWSVCGVFIADVLGVPVLTYLPFAFFCLLSPLITVIFGGKSNSAQIQKQA